MLLAINPGIAKHAIETYSDFDKKIFSTNHSIHTNRYLKIITLILFVLLGKSNAYAVENYEEMENDDAKPKKIWINKIYENFHEDLSFSPYQEEQLNLSIVSRLTDSPEISGNTVGYSIGNNIKIPVKIIEGIDDQGFAAESLLNDDGGPEIRFSWKFIKYLYRYHADVFDIVFKFVMYHETAHVLNGDIYKFSIFPDLNAEIKADSYAAGRLRDYCEFNLTMEGFLSVHQIYNAFIDHFEDSESSIKDIAMRLEYLSKHGEN